MAIVKLKPDEPINSPLTSPQTIAAPIKSNFNDLIPESRINSLLQYTEGKPWTVNYYGQILNENNTLNSFDPSIPNVLNPYYKVISLILQVQSDLSTTYDSSTSTTSINGTAITPYKLIPNVGDIFLANVDSGHDAIFLIKNVDRKTYRKETLYEITYSLYFYVSQQPIWLNNIESKVQQIYYFNKDNGYYNRDVLILPEVKEATDRLKSFLEESKDFYFNKFYNYNKGTLLIPGIEKTLYDHKLIEFILKTNNITDHECISKLYINNYYNDLFMKQPCLYNTLITKQIKDLSIVNKQYSFIGTEYFYNNPKLAQLGIIGIDYCLYPINADISYSISHKPNYKYLTPLDNTVDPRTQLNTNINPTVVNDFIPDNITVDTISGTKNLLHLLFKNNYYLVTEDFYLYANDTTSPSANNISYIEFLIYKFIKRQAISSKDLVIAIQNYRSWSNLNQLYLLPVMWYMIKELI